MIGFVKIQLYRKVVFIDTQLFNILFNHSLDNLELFQDKNLKQEARDKIKIRTHLQRINNKRENNATYNRKV